MARVGYTRVSTIDQNLDRQLDGIPVDRVFADKISGKNTHRPALEELLEYVRAGDIVVVHSMDRLARNLDDLRQLVRAAYDNGNGSFTVPMPQNDGSLVIGIVIESADAPTEYAFELKVPSGATLKPLEQGVGLYDSDGNLFGGVAPPWARDAAGQAIDTHLEIRGDTVVQTVAHRSGQIAYPVSADPWLGLDLLDWTSRSDCPNSRCPGRSSGYVISAGLSAWGVYWRYTGSGTAILNGSGWSELVSKRPAADNNNNRMRPQWTCHAIGAYPPLTGGSWDLESWRPEIWDSAVWWQSRCNW